MSDQIESAAALMVRDYLVLAFLVSLGALQISVSISGIRGLWVLPHRNLTRAFGILLIILGLAYYLLSPLWIEGPWAAGSVVDGTSENRIWGTASVDEISGARNLNDIHGGMAGTAYAVFFVLSAVLTTLFAAVIGTINNRLFPSPSRSEGDAWSEAITQGGGEPTGDGLDALKTTSPLTTFKSSLHNLRDTGANDIHNQMQSAHRWSIPSVIGRMWRN
ncbi:MAG: hypothetical protein F4Y63_02635 [Chloroflexi bacterium]|nr:hypothetical protein [Chloroflexota bacterium]MYK61775.1 hypothetical protein [Chloroflexota bacterium]